MIARLKEMLLKELRQTLRDPRMRMVILVLPVVQLIIFGYAANTDVRHIAMAVHDLDQTVTSREIISRLVRSGYFDQVRIVEGDAEARDLLNRGTVRCVLRLNRGFEELVRAGRTAPLQLLVDGSDSNTASIVLNYAGRTVAEYSEDAQREQWARRRGAALEPGRVELRVRAWFNEDLASRNYYVPGLIGTIVSLMSLILTSMAIVREREIGTMEQILVTPIRPAEFILGKTLPFAGICLLDVVFVAGVGVLWFGVPIRGSWVVLLAGVLLFLMTTLGIGLFISTVSHTQQQAMMTTFFFFMPAMLLSGFMFPIASMPEPVQWVTYLNPLRHFLIIIRGVFLKGVGWEVLWPQMAALALLGTLTLGFTTRRFRKTLA